MKLKRFYDYVNRPFDCSSTMGCQRANPFTTNCACVVVTCNDCYNNTPSCLKGLAHAKIIKK